VESGEFMGDIYFIRHGQASFGQDNYDKISETGDIQSMLLAEYLYNAGIVFDAVYSGTLERQKHTANRFISYYAEKKPPAYELKFVPDLNEYNSKEIIKHYLPLVLNEDPSLAASLNNIYADKKAFQKLFNAVMLKMVSGKYHFPRVETWQDFQTRVRTAINGIMTEIGQGKKIIIFSSGGPISAVIQIATGTSDEATMRLAWQLANTSITTFKYNNEGISLHSFNNYPHLELYKEKNLITFR
jgi:broad specificity phosphatase PhoE